MTDNTDRIIDRDLEAFFEAARRTAPEPSSDLLARVLEDAYTAQPGPVLEAETTTDADGRPGWLSTLVSTIGGWPAVAGLATAAVAGVWIGYNPPQVFDSISTAFLDSSYGLTMDSSLPDYASILADG